MEDSEKVLWQGAPILHLSWRVGSVAALVLTAGQDVLYSRQPLGTRLLTLLGLGLGLLLFLAWYAGKRVRFTSEGLELRHSWLPASWVRSLPWQQVECFAPTQLGELSFLHRNARGDLSELVLPPPRDRDGALRVLADLGVQRGSGGSPLSHSKLTGHVVGLSVFVGLAVMLVWVAFEAQKHHFPQLAGFGALVMGLQVLLGLSGYGLILRSARRRGRAAGLQRSDREINKLFLFLVVFGVALLAASHYTPVHTKALISVLGGVGVLAALSHTLLALLLRLGLPWEVLIFGSAFGYLLAREWL